MGAVIVRVRKDHRWPQVRVASRIWHKRGTTISEDDLSPEIRQAPVLEIEWLDETDAVDATEAAVELAAEAGIDLRQVAGTGLDGRVLVRDVQEVIDD